LDNKITFKKSVSKDLKRINHTNVLKILDRIETELVPKTKKIPELQGQFVGLRRFCIGNYKIIFTIINGTILVLRIQHRKDVYKK